jgi:hypothetical protein
MRLVSSAHANTIRGDRFGSVNSGGTIPPWVGSTQTNKMIPVESTTSATFQARITMGNEGELIIHALKIDKR